MRRRSPWVSAIVVVIALSATTARAGWMEVFSNDAKLNLAAAREEALRTIRSDSTSAEAVAAAGWWLENIQAVPEPEAILGVAGAKEDPELAFILARVESTLDHRPPRGVLGKVELAGPFGVFDTLDLERNVVPDDADLPPLGSLWRAAATPFRLVLRPAYGTVRPPEELAASGVYLAAWTLTVPSAVNGWMAVEAQGGYNLELDGKQVAQERECGDMGAGVHWYRLRLDPGSHRLRASFASVTVPQLRVSILSHDGDAPRLGVNEPGAGRPWAPSSIVAARPPAEEETVAGAGHSPPVATALLAAQLAHLRHDPVEQQRWLEAAVATGSDQKLVHLAYARFFLTERTGEAAEVDYRHAREHLDHCSGLGFGLLVGRLLAERQQRQQDAETALDQLVDSYPDDPRVLQMSVHDAIKRGWAREAESGIARLRAELPGSPWVTRLRLVVLRALERWGERKRLLEALAESEPLAPDTVDLVASAALKELAIKVVNERRREIDDPALDLGLIRLLYETGKLDQARQELAGARQRWGDLRGLDELEIALAAQDGHQALATAVNRVLHHTPSDLGLRTLAWRLGAEPFFSSFRVDAGSLAAAQGSGPKDVDSELILDQAVERVYQDGSSIYYYHGLTRALTSAGVQQAAALQLLPGSVLLQVRIFKADGTIVVPPDLDSGQAGQVLEGVKPGDMVESEYIAAVAPTGASRRGHLSPYVYRFADAGRPFDRSEYVLLVPRDVALKVDGNVAGLEHQDRDWNDLRLISWSAKNVPPVQEEPLSPPTQELVPWVSYGFGVTWQDVGDALRNRLLPSLQGSPELWAWGDQHAAGTSSLDVARALVTAIDDEVEQGQGRLDPRSTAGESFSLRKGNRLGILASLLKHLGWRVDLVLARPRELAGTHLEVPTLDSFTVPLLRVAHAGETVWIDPAEQRRGVDHIRPILQGSDALLVPLSVPQKPVSRLARLPEFPNPDLEQQVRLEARIDTSGAADLNYRLVVHGAQGERLLDVSQTVSAERLQVMYQQLAAGLFSGAEGVSGAVKRTDDGVLLSLDLRLPDACTAEAGTLVCRNLVLLRPISPALASLSKRTMPLVLQLPLEQRFDMTLHLPAGRRIEGDPRRLDSPWGKVSEELSTNGNLYHSILHLSIPAQTVSPASYPEFARFCHAVDELLARPARLTGAAR
jgi:hypothetical protein